MFGKVAVLMGGDSSERAISLKTGQAVLDALIRQGVDAVAIDARDHFIERLQREGFSRAFLALHGKGGEDGSIQGLLESLKIPYTGSGVLASALAFDKIKTKRIWNSLGLPTPPFTLYDAATDPQDMIKLFGLPLIIKPVLEGSSIGVHKALTMTDLENYYKQCSELGPVMLEQYIAGDEYTVGILGNRALPSIQIVTTNDFYDYDAKYNSNATKYICPSPLTSKYETYIQKIALAAFNAIGAKGWGRVDFIRDLNGDFWLLEVNTTPGMTNTSLVPKAAKIIGLDFDQLVMEILSQTLHVKEEQGNVAAQSKTKG